MPLCGYRDLAFLKARLLPADLGDDGAWDDDLQQIGRGVASLFDTVTGRKLRREEGIVHECSADAASVTLTSYPIESIDSVVHRSFGTESDITDAVQNTIGKAGIVHLGGAYGTSEETLLITSTGGFWCDDGEAMPDGATPLPDDLLNAWVQQCRAVCEAEDTFRQKGAGKAEKKAGLEISTLTLLPGVKATLNRYMRFP